MASGTTLVPIADQTKVIESEEKERGVARRRIKHIAAITVVMVIAVTCIVMSFQDLTHATTIRRIPLTYATSEFVPPEERDVLSGVRTSFVPTTAIVVDYGLREYPSSDDDSSHARRRKRDDTAPQSEQLSISVELKDTDYADEDLKNQSDQDESYLEMDKPITNSFLSLWKSGGDADFIRKSQSKIMGQHMDSTVDPCDDFYQYACGNWAKRNPMPADKAGYDTFEMLRENLDIVLRDLLESESPPGGLSEAETKAKLFYESCMDHEVLARRANSPLDELLRSMGGWPAIHSDWNESAFDWVRLMAELRRHNNDILVSQWVGPDVQNSDRNVMQFDQTSLGLPSRDYFLSDNNIPYLKAYQKYMTKTLVLLGSTESEARKSANEIIQFETNLAMITISPEERHNVTELYQRLSLQHLSMLVPKIDWRQYMLIVLDREVDDNEIIIVFALNYMQELVNLIERSKSKTVANYLLWRFVRHRVNNLDDKFQEVKQTFYFTLFGREQSPPRWKSCVVHVNANMGMALGSMFVKRYFDENSKNDTLIMTREIQRSFRELLDATEWIDDETKRLANDKVESMMLKIGYPAFITDSTNLDAHYRDLVIESGKFFENTINMLKFLAKMEHDKLGRSVNRTLWDAAPSVVNAYYSRNKNQIMFPAGILQPPFYHRYFPKSLNFGGIGVVIGHEITHGFDDKGRLFDKDGNFHRWWQDMAIEKFHQRAHCLIDQYGLYTVSEVSMPLDGMNTQGENIADNGGIKQSFRAYKHWLERNNYKDEILPGLNMTNPQLFFLNFAQIWCGTFRPEAMKNKLKTSIHSPGKFRVIGTLSNSEDFAKEYKCPLGSPMNPVKKCAVW